MEEILREPVELIDSDLDVVAGGALNGIFNFHSFNLNGSSNGNGNGNGNSGLLNLNGNFNGDLDGNILAISLEVPVSITL